MITGSYCLGMSSIQPELATAPTVLKHLEYQISLQTQMWRVGTCHTNVHNLTLVGEERHKPLLQVLSSLYA